MRLLITVVMGLLCTGVFAQDEAQPAAEAPAESELPSYPRVLLETTEGNIMLELERRRAPLTVQHFVDLVRAGHYDGTIFHRVIRGFMIQGGGYDRDLNGMEEEGSVFNESGNGLPNLRGTIAMARLNDPHTANAQFFINLVDNRRLDPQSTRWGYAVFGSVIEGMDVVDAIALLPTAPAGQFESDVPVVPVIIEKATYVEP